MFKLLAFLIAASFFISQTFAWRPSERDCDNKICLTSFKWCKSDGKDCYYPDYVYRQENNQGSLPALVWEKEYDVTWKVMDSSGNGDINITWQFAGGEKPQGVFWSTKIDSKDSSFKFKPSREMFKNSPNNISFTEAQGLVNQHTTLRIRRGTDDNDSRSIEISDSFIVLTSTAPNFIDAAVNEQRRFSARIWRITAGIGIAISWVLSALITYVLVSWSPKRRARRDGKLGQVVPLLPYGGPGR